PARGQRAGLGFTVADDARDEQVGIVERGAERVTDRVAELATFVNRAGRLGSNVTRHAARERELAEQLVHPALVARDRGIGMCVRAFEPDVGMGRGAAVAGTAGV